MIRVKTNDLIGMNWAEWQMHPSEEFAVKGAKKLGTSWRELFFSPKISDMKWVYIQFKTKIVQEMS